MLVVVHQPLHAPNTSRGELESNRLELASNKGLPDALLLERSGRRTREKALFPGPPRVAGAGFEPATSGL